MHQQVKSNDTEDDAYQRAHNEVGALLKVADVVCDTYVTFWFDQRAFQFILRRGGVIKDSWADEAVEIHGYLLYDGYVNGFALSLININEL